MDAQSRRYTAVEQTYLGDIADDFGGHEAARIGQESAQKYLNARSKRSMLELGPATYKPKVVTAALATTALAIVVNFGEVRDVLIGFLG